MTLEHLFDAELHYRAGIDPLVEPAGREGDLCCQVLSFVSSATTAERYLVENPTVSGHPISIREAIEIGRLVSANILKED